MRSLLHRSQQPHLVQSAIYDAGLGGPFLEELLRGEINELPDSWQASGYFSMLPHVVGENDALKFAADLLGSNTPATIARMLRAWPTERSTWDAASALSGDVLQHYWLDFSSHYIDGDQKTLLAVVANLMRHDRSLVALESVLNRINEVPTELVFGMLDAIVGELNAGQKSSAGGLLDYRLEETLKALDKRNLPDIEIAKREYALRTLGRAPDSGGTHAGARDATSHDRKAHWRRDDLLARMAFALDCAEAHGVAAIRTHLDSHQSQAPETWAAFAEMRAAFADRIALQAVALVPMD